MTSSPLRDIAASRSAVAGSLSAASCTTTCRCRGMRTGIAAVKSTTVRPMSSSVAGSIDDSCPSRPPVSRSILRSGRYMDTPQRCYRSLAYGRGHGRLRGRRDEVHRDPDQRKQHPEVAEVIALVRQRDRDRCHDTGCERLHPPELAAQLHRSGPGKARAPTQDESDQQHECSETDNPSLEQE